MKRRDTVFASLLLGSLLPTVWSQQQARVWRIGVLSLSVPAEPGMRPRIAQMLGPYGYEAGRNLVIDFRFAQEKKEQLPAMAAELLAGKPDLLIGLLNDEIIALKHATSAIPIVMMYVSAPVETGLIASLARPGGNLTGTTTSTFEQAGKMMQIFKEAIPGMSRIAVLHEPEYPGMNQYLDHMEHVATAMRVQVTRIAVRTAADLDVAFRSMDVSRPGGIAASMTGAILLHRARIIDYAARQKIPAHYSISPVVREGGLMSYAPNFQAMAARNASQIDKIFKGTKPGDIPVEEPAQFVLSINIKTANALGLAIPKSLLLRADVVIQ